MLAFLNPEAPTGLSEAELRRQREMLGGGLPRANTAAAIVLLAVLALAAAAVGFIPFWSNGTSPIPILPRGDTAPGIETPRQALPAWNAELLSGSGLRVRAKSRDLKSSMQSAS